MNAAEMTFGVEFEVCIPNATAVIIGRYHHGMQVRELPTGWTAQNDTSIHPPVGYKAVEIVSPVLKGAEGLQQVVAVCKWLQAVGAKVNQTTGFHVHIGFDKNNQAALKRLVATFANHEKAIYAITGTRARENNTYCRSVLQSADIKHVHKHGLPSYLNRYFLLNIANLIGRMPTVEFRAFAGTTSETKAIGYIRVALGFVERAIQDTCPRCFGRKLPKSVVDGQSATKRLFSFLGWDKRQPVFGALEADNTPSILECKKELIRLAAKYDAADA
jgi:hypothetical protein